MRLDRYAGTGLALGVIVPISSRVHEGPGEALQPAAGHLRAWKREMSDWPVSHSALPGRAWWVTSAAFFYNKSYKEPRHE